MNSSIYRGVLTIFAVGICSFPDAFAQTANLNAARNVREEQQRAMTLTRKLLDDNLNSLLRQLEENRLTDHEVYLEIVSLRRNLIHLAETDMLNIVQVLTESDRVPNSKIADSMVSIRKRISDVVRKLSIEHQVILKRLRIVELASRLKELIQLQSAVRDTTNHLLTDRHGQQESLVLQTIEDQRNVKESYLILVDIMDDVRQWTGPWATVAAQALSVVKVAKVGPDLDDAGRNLQSLQFAKANEIQTRLIKTMNTLLSIVLRASGNFESSDLAIRERIRELIDLQTRIRDTTRSLIDGTPATTELIDEQSKVHQEIVELQATLPESTIVQNHSQKAETSAFEAAAKLLGNDRDAAVADQASVLGHLLAVERTLADIAGQSHFKSASQMAQLVSNLSVMQIRIREAHAKHDSSLALGYQEHAATELKTVADLIRDLLPVEDLPSPIPTALTNLADATDEEAAKLADPELDLKSESVGESGQLVREAFDKAEASITLALQDAKRVESAIVIGELARSAEVLERLAAEEKSIADVFHSQVVNSGSPDTAGIVKRTADRHAEVIAIANKLILATEQTASTASNPMKAAVQILDQSKANLIRLAEQETDVTSDQMIPSSKTAIESSQQFGAAAKLIRQEISNTATALNQRLTKHADELFKTEKDVVSAIERSTSNDGLSQLVSARLILNKVLRQQAVAIGKPEVAAALLLQTSLAAAMDIQDEIDSMTLNPGAGETSDIRRLSKQADLSERLQSLLEMTNKSAQSFDPQTRQSWSLIAQQVDEAFRASTEAARQELEGAPASAAVSSDSVRAALTNARKSTLDQIDFSTKQPATEIPDPKAQGEVATSIRALHLQQLSSKRLAESLREATLGVEEAENTFSRQDPPTSEVQTKLWSALWNLDQQFDVEIRNAATWRATEMSDRAADYHSLAKRLLSVESAAGEAVKVAERQAHQSSKFSESARRIQISANQIEMALTRAATDLGVAERVGRQDAELAASIVNQISQQQNAAEIIAKRAALLEQSDSSGIDDETSSTSRRKIARELEDAQQRFVEALRTTGQAAVDLSRQREVANVALREALAMASNLQSNAASIEIASDQNSIEANAVSTEDEPLITGQNTAANDSSVGEKSAAATRDPRDHQPGGNFADGSRSAKPNEMGTGFVSQSADLTAEMMAGSKAQREAKKSLEQQLPVSQQPADDANNFSNMTEDGDGSESITSENAGESRLSKKEGAASRNQSVKGGAADKQREGTEAAGMASSKARENEERISGRRFQESTWFAKLPPDIQRSIRTGTSQKPPKAYEERLKRYFQSTD